MRRFAAVIVMTALMLSTPCFEAESRYFKTVPASWIQRQTKIPENEVYQNGKSGDESVGIVVLFYEGTGKTPMQLAQAMTQPLMATQHEVLVAPRGIGKYVAFTTRPRTKGAKKAVLQEYYFQYPGGKVLQVTAVSNKLEALDAERAHIEELLNSYIF